MSRSSFVGLSLHVIDIYVYIYIYLSLSLSLSIYIYVYMYKYVYVCICFSSSVDWAPRETAKEARSSPNSQQRDGLGALHFAALHGRLDAIPLLRPGSARGSR